MEPVDVLVDRVLGAILEENPGPSDRLDGIVEHPLSTNISVFRSLLRDVILVVEDEPFLGGVTFPVRADRVKARPHSLGHDLAEGCGCIHLRGVVLVLHACQHLLGPHQLFLGELSSVCVDRDLVIVLEECRVNRSWERLRDGVFVCA